MRTLAAAVLALSATLLSASDDFVIDPPAPDTASLIRITFLSGCLGSDPSVTISGKTINIVVRNMPGVGGCIAAYTPSPLTTTIGPLPHGTYEVQAFGKPFTSLVVREATPFTVSPFAVPTTGGTMVHLQRGGLAWPSDYGSARPTVKLGNQPVQPILEYPIGFIAPPAAPGAVDITIDSRYYGQTSTPNLYTAHSSLIYYDPSQPPNQSVADPLLFPIAFDGPGAHGSQWQTVNSVTRVSPDSTYGTPAFYHPPCEACEVTVKDKLTLPPMKRPDGLLLWLLRGTEQYTRASSYVRDVSRPDSGPGATVPVVRGNDFGKGFVLPRVTVGPGTRAVLRVWSVEDQAFDVMADGYVPVDGKPKQFFKILRMIRFSDQPLLFASADVTSLLQLFGTPVAPPGLNATFDLNVYSLGGMRRIWAMVSVTDNETQRVTIIAPD